MPIVYNLPYKKFNELRPEVTEQILGQFPQVVNGSAFCYPTIRLQAYMNHSDEANYNAFDDITLRDIKAGDEITENYRLIEGHKKVFAFLK